jgi:hypothetical protein
MDMVHYLDLRKPKSFHSAFAGTESESDTEIPQFISQLGGLY